STCLTFLTTRQTLRSTQDVFRSYARRNFDTSVWLSLTKESIARPLDFCRWLAQDRLLAKIIAKTWLFGWKQILFGKRHRLWVLVPGMAKPSDANPLSPVNDWAGLMLDEEPAYHSNVLNRS